MAEKVIDVANVVETDKVAKSASKVAVVVPEVETFTLSSGVEVIFKEIPSQIIQKAIADVMGGVKRDAKNNITFANGKELEAIKSVTKYHDILILMGVKLAKPLEEVATEMQLSQLEILAGDVVDDMKEYYFLRYFAFSDADDFALLTEKTVNLST